MAKSKQLKRADSGEGVRNPGTQSGSAGSRNCNTSMGKDYSADALHTASWIKGATLTVKREG